VLPNLIVIGAERCGTTSLYRYLGAHPEIFMAKTKELDFFVTELNWRKGRGWYEQQFGQGSRVRGESSPSYTAYPVHTGVAKRMAALVPDAKLIYLVRDPIERTLSGYHHQRAQAMEGRPLADALSDVNESRHIWRSRYAAQLELFLEHFPLEQILVVDSHELRTRRRETLARIFRFLGIDERFWADTLALEYNTRRSRQRTLLGAGLWVSTVKVLGKPRTYAVAQRLPALMPFSRKLEPPALDAELRRSLADVFREDVARLREYTGLEFATWSI
jgi:sulfotransferase family protein